MATCPGSTRFDSLAAYLDKERAESARLLIDMTVRTMPLEEWESQHNSAAYGQMLRTLPPDDDEIIAIVRLVGQADR